MGPLVAVEGGHVATQLKADGAFKHAQLVALLVIGQAALVDVRLPTLVAVKGSLWHHAAALRLQREDRSDVCILVTFRLLVAFAVLCGSAGQMNRLVRLQLRRQTKTFPTVGTGVLPKRGVAAQVVLHGRGVPVFFPTDGAQERTHFMSPSVIGQAAGVSVATPTFVAFEFAVVL